MNRPNDGDDDELSFVDIELDTAEKIARHNALIEEHIAIEAQRQARKNGRNGHRNGANGYTGEPRRPELNEAPAPAVPPMLTVSDVLRSPAFTTPRRTVPTGIAALDELIGGGLKSRQLAVIAGPTGKGKTGLVGTLAMSLARTGQCVLWVTTELDDAEQAARFAAMAMRSSGVNATPDDFLGHTIPAEYGAQATDGMPIYLVNLDDPDGDVLATIRELVALRVREDGQPPVLIVDYMQVLAPEDAERRRMSVSKVATAMRRLARDFDTAALVISSVSRAYYGPGKQKKAEGEEEDPRDWIAAAKESGDIEYACSVFGYLDTANEINSLGESDARLIIAKARAGRPGFVGLKFHGPSGLFIAESQSVANMRPERRRSGPPDTDKVLAYVRNHPGQTLKALKCSIAGLGKDKVEVAIEELQVKGLVEARHEEFRDASDRVQRRSVWHPAVAPAKASDGN